MSLWQALREVTVKTWRMVRRNPWMLAWPLLVIWYLSHTEEERRTFIEQATRP